MVCSENLVVNGLGINGGHSGLEKANLCVPYAYTAKSRQFWKVLWHNVHKFTTDDIWHSQFQYIRTMMDEGWPNICSLTLGQRLPKLHCCRGYNHQNKSQQEVCILYCTFAGQTTRNIGLYMWCIIGTKLSGQWTNIVQNYRSAETNSDENQSNVSIFRSNLLPIYPKLNDALQAYWTAV